MTSEATFSECGHYRYTLHRTVSLLRPTGTVMFVMLNPSTADSRQDDPTIRRCLRFSTTWGFDELIVTNLYALRSTDPTLLWEHEDPVGPDNDDVIRQALQCYPIIVCAWGNMAKFDRVKEFVAITKEANRQLWSLGTTLNGSPRHPLYVSGRTELEHWVPNY